jgi:hypothetical protein
MSIVTVPLPEDERSVILKYCVLYFIGCDNGSISKLYQ